MKKRKELDALLLNNMNGKKMSKSPSGKEGHELLRNEASWDSNSTENDEFFSPPRRLTIRKPQKWRFCATSIQLCVFVVMVACIVVTGGLVWMHLDLKQDLDELRLRIAKVESDLETSKDQASTVSTLQRKVEQLQNLREQISIINRQIGQLNSTASVLKADIKAARDEIKTPPTTSIDGLQQSMAQFGSTMQEVQDKENQHTEQIDALTSSLDQWKMSLTELQGEVAKLQQTTPVPTPKSGPEPSNPTAATGYLDISKAVQSLQQGQDGIYSAVGELNTTVTSIQLWQRDLMPRIVAVESTMHASDTPNGSLAEKLTELQAEVNMLKSSISSQTPGMTAEGQTQGPLAIDSQQDWNQEMESRIQTIQKRLDGLNPQNLNNNLLNINTTQGIQNMIERALGVFKEENLKSVDDLQQEHQDLRGRLNQQQSNIDQVQQEVDDLQVRVQDLENGEEKLSTLESAVEHSLTTDGPSH